MKMDNGSFLKNKNGGATPKQCQLWYQVIITTGSHIEFGRTNPLYHRISLKNDIEKGKH